MDYEKIVDLDSVTVSECMWLYEHQNLRVVIENGRIVNFETEIET